VFGHRVPLNFELFFALNEMFFMFSDCFDMPILKIIFLLKKFILMHLEAKNTLNRHHHHNPKHTPLFESVVVVIFQSAFHSKIYHNNIFYFLKIIFNIIVSK